MVCNCIHELLNVFEDSAQREHTIAECNIMICNTEYCSFFENTAIPFVQYYCIFCIIAKREIVLLVLCSDYRIDTNIRKLYPEALKV